MNHTPEPWDADPNPGFLTLQAPTTHDLIASFERPSDLLRAHECVNACAGIKDPAAAIAAARDALVVCRHSPCCDWHTAIDTPPGQCDCGLEEAIELLTPKP